MVCDNCNCCWWSCSIQVDTSFFLIVLRSMMLWSTTALWTGIGTRRGQLAPLLQATTKQVSSTSVQRHCRGPEKWAEILSMRKQSHFFWCSKPSIEWFSVCLNLLCARPRAFPLISRSWEVSVLGHLMGVAQCNLKQLNYHGSLTPDFIKSEVGICVRFQIKLWHCGKYGCSKICHRWHDNVACYFEAWFGSLIHVWKKPCVNRWLLAQRHPLCGWKVLHGRFAHQGVALAWEGVGGDWKSSLFWKGGKQTFEIVWWP